MERIELLTSNNSHVAFVEITRFQAGCAPEVILWGTRTFARRGTARYVEVFAAVSLTPSPGLPPIEFPPIPPVDRRAQTTTDGRSVDEVRAEQSQDGNKMHASYIILSDEERAKGFVRPVRRSYKHTGLPKPAMGSLRSLTAEETVRYEKYGYVKFEAYPPSDNPCTGRYWTQVDLDRAARVVGLSLRWV